MITTHQSIEHPQCGGSDKNTEIDGMLPMYMQKGIYFSERVILYLTEAERENHQLCMEL